MKRRTIATVLLLVFVLSGQASAFSFFSKKSIKEMEDKVVEILKEPDPMISELNFKIHSAEVHYDAKEKAMKIKCRAASVSNPGNWVQGYFYRKIPKLYNEIPKLDVIHVYMETAGYYEYMIKRDDATWIGRLYFELSRKSFEKADWKRIRTDNNYSMYRDVFDYCVVNPTNVEM